MSEYIEQIEDENPEALKCGGFDDCIIGIARRCGHEPLLCYSKPLMIAKLCAEDDMTEQDALEHFEYNILGAWCGDGTPIFIESS